MLRALGRIRVRLLIVNLVVLIVPVAGFEFARIYERQLLSSLERDMRNQSALVREAIESGLDAGASLAEPRTQQTLTSAARQTRTRIRILDTHGIAVVDSHSHGPPEGPEPPAPTIIPESAYNVASSESGSWGRRRQRGRSNPDAVEMLGSRSIPMRRWPDVPNRREVVSALAGHPDAYTRIREEEPAVFLFVSDPIRHDGDVVGAVYVTRSTRPVLAELYKIRTGLIEVLIVAVVLTLLLTLVLSWSISRPLSRLARAARRIAGGEQGVKVPADGGGEIRELGEAFATMTEQLDARMRYIRDFAGDVAHELKSPLTSIRGAAELLSEGAADDPEARKRFLENIQLDAERLDRLVTRLLELSRIDASREPMQDMDFGALIERVVDRTDTDDHPVEVVWKTPLRQWRGREEDIERAVLNLVENAVRFSPDDTGPTVTISSIALSASARKLAALEVRIADRGPGVPKADRERIFERFFTTDADRNGTGLGLAIVRSVASAHGGTIELAPTETGATFVLTLMRQAHA